MIPVKEGVIRRQVSLIKHNMRVYINYYTFDLILFRGRIINFDFNLTFKIVGILKCYR